MVRKGKESENVDRMDTEITIHGSEYSEVSKYIHIREVYEQKNDVATIVLFGV